MYSKDTYSEMNLQLSKGEVNNVAQLQAKIALKRN
jgi:hypothetical protein